MIIVMRIPHLHGPGMDEFLLDSSHSIKDIERAFNKACDDFCFNLIDDVNQNQDGKLPRDFAKKLIIRGFKEERAEISTFFSSYFEENGRSVKYNSRDIVRIIMFMAGKFLMDFEYSFVDKENAEHWKPFMRQGDGAWIM